jgi:hypothetical protein
MVLTALSGQLITPERLPEVLSHARKHQRANSAANIHATERFISAISPSTGRDYVNLIIGIHGPRKAIAV